MTIKPPKKKPTATELAYISGIIDGEGSISVSKITVNRKLTIYLQTKIKLSIYNCHIGLLKWIQKKVGGSLHVMDSRKSNWKCVGCLQFGADATVKLLRLVLPHLIVKHEQARLAIAFQNTRILRGRKRGVPEKILEIRNTLATSISTLNKRGVTHASN